MDIFCKVTDLGLIPLYDSDFENKKKLKKGDIVRCRITKPRNYKFHKKFFALLRLTFTNLPERLHDEWGIRTESDLLTWLKLDIGLATFAEYNGMHVVREKSISFSAMDDYEFERFYDACVNVILTKYLRGVERADLLGEIENFM